MVISVINLVVIEKPPNDVVNGVGEELLPKIEQYF